MLCFLYVLIVDLLDSIYFTKKLIYIRRQLIVLVVLVGLEICGRPLLGLPILLSGCLFLAMVSHPFISYQL